MGELEKFIGRTRKPMPEAGVRTELGRGIAVRRNIMNPFLVVTLRYEADPAKDPLTDEGKEWVISQMRDMGCRRVCRECDKPWAVTDEICPECGNETELVLSNSWKREYEIDYSAQAGSYVFDSFSRARNTCKPFRIPNNWRRYRVIDHGVRNPTACLWIAVDPDRQAWVYREHYEAGQSVNYHARQIHRISVEADQHALELSDSVIRELEMMSWTPSKDFIARCSRLYKTLGDPSMNNRTQMDVATVRQRYMENGIYIGLANHATPALETVNTLFGSGQLTIFDICQNTIREVEGLVWDENNDPATNKKEREKDRDNHTTDALKYWANDFAPPAKDGPPQKAIALSAEERAERHRDEFVTRLVKKNDVRITEL